jgi:hypothetical protein
MLLVVVLVTILPAMRAEAACGDYLLVRGGNGAQSHHDAGKDVDQRTIDDHRNTPAAPCRGPRCSRQSVPLVPPAPSARHSPPDKAALTFLNGLGIDALHVIFSQREQLSETIHRTNHIFRPPRVVLPLG